MKARFHLFLALMVMLPFGLLAQSPVGTWKMSVPDESGNMIPLKVAISEDGTYTLDFGADGNIDAKGKYTVEAGKMTIQDTEGRACSGIHQLAASGKFYFILRWIFSR
jgi:hypothetical protein